MTRALPAVVLLALLAGSACRREGVGGPPPSPGWGVEAGPSVAKADADAEAPRSPGALRPTLQDPRLAEVRAGLRGRDVGGASKKLGEILARGGLAPEDRCAFTYLAGRLASQLEDPAAAEASFEQAADDACPLAPYARLRGAQAALRRHRGEVASSLAARVPPDIAAADEARLVEAEGLAAKGDRAASVKLWRASLSEVPRGARWIDTATRLALALVDGAAGPPAEAAKEAFDVATRVVLEAPRQAEALGATTARTRAAALLKLPTELTPAERARRAQGLLEGGEAQRALGEASSLLGEPKLSPEVGCRAAIVRAQATAKTAKSAAQADAWGDAIPRCEADPELVTVLFSGGKASVSARRMQEALYRFEQLEKRFPSHRLADDARLRGALLVEEQGDLARAIDMLSTLPDAYPTGDMRGEALFRVALFSMKRGDFAAARAPLERIEQLLPDDRHWATAGRATYFLARALERGGDLQGAKARWERLVTFAPLSFYMAQSYARIAEREPEAARALLAKGAGAEGGSFPPLPRELAVRPAFLRALRLLEVGENDAARREFQLSGALAEGAAPETLWAVGDLFDRAGAWEIGHAFSRSRLTDHLAHWPEGKYRTPWEVAFPRAFAEDVSRASAAHGVPASLLWGIMREESSFMPEVRSPANAYGLMQIIPPTAKWISGGVAVSEADLKKPDVSIELGAKLLAKLRTTHGHPALAIAAYNGGSGAVNRWVDGRTTDDFDLFVELVPYEETRNYVKRVVASQVAYAYLYDRPHLEEVLRLPAKVAP